MEFKIITDMPLIMTINPPPYVFMAKSALELHEKLFCQVFICIQIYWGIYFGKMLLWAINLITKIKVDIFF